jgi:DNA ligase (NAD+)
MNMSESSLQEKLQKASDNDFNDTNNFYPSNFVSHEDELKFLSDQGFPINPFNQKKDSIDNIIKSFEDLGEARNTLPYPIDGLVLKLYNNAISSRLGVVGKTPRSWCAMKFAAEEATTRLLDVIWQVGRTGKLTPVACLDDTELAGTIVKRATLHSYKEVVEKDLYYKDTLVIRKAGDIIPEVVQVIRNIRSVQDGLKHNHFDTNGRVSIPSLCPSCKSMLILTDTNVDLYCPNVESCHDQVAGRLAYYCQRNMANITGLSDKIIEKFIEKFKIHDIYDLYRLPWDEIRVLEGFGEKSVENLSKSVVNSKTILDYKFLSALGIDGIGPEVAKLICEKLNENEIYDNKQN